MSIELYMGAESLDALDRAHDAIASNLASINTPGHRAFKVKHGSMSQADSVEFKDYIEKGKQVPKVSFTRDMSPGNPYTTGVDTHVALTDDESMFSFDGGKVFDRDGQFFFDKDNNLVTKYGLKVDGEGGAITRDPSGGMVHIDSGGNVMQGDTKIAKLKVVKIDNIDNFTETQGGLMPKPGFGDPEVQENVRMIPRSLEASNVSPIKQMIELMRVTNSAQSLQKVLHTEEATRRSANSNLIRS